jgi:hypothetical protein
MRAGRPREGSLTAAASAFGLGAFALTALVRGDASEKGHHDVRSMMRVAMVRLFAFDKFKVNRAPTPEG